MLQGGVEHAEQLPPVQSRLGVGTTYDESKLEKPVPVKIWYRVPLWMAGKWQFDEEHIFSEQDLRTGRVYPGGNVERRHAEETWGCQQDRFGGIWDFISVPLLTEVKSDKEIWKDMHTNDSVMTDTENDVVMRWVYTRRVVSRATGKISGIEQAEQLSRFLPYGPDLIRTLYSVKFFDQKGRPTSLLKTWKIGRRVGAFKPWNIDEKGNDIRAMFRQYLISQGLQQLVPVDY